MWCLFGNGSCTSLKKCLRMEVMSCGERSERSTCSFCTSKAWQIFWMRGLDPLTRYTPSEEKQKKPQRYHNWKRDILFCTFSVTVVVNNTWTVRARVSISDVQCSTTKGTCSGLSRSSRERSTPNTVPFLCSHSSWHTSIHFLCKASPHWRCNGMEDREQKQFYSSSVMFLRTPCYCKCLPPHTSSHSTPLTTM